MRYVFCGTLVHSTSETMMDVCHDGIMGVDNDGKVTITVKQHVVWLTSQILS